MLSNLSLSYEAGTALTLSIHSNKHSLKSSASITSDAQLTQLMCLINTATAELNSLLKNHLQQPQRVDCLSADLVSLMNGKYGSLMESEQAEVKDLLNAASNVLEYPSVGQRPLINNTDKAFEKAPLEYLVDRIATHRGSSSTASSMPGFCSRRH